MSNTEFVDTNTIRSLFSQAMSAMYQNEVPQYGSLIDLVKEVNTQVLQSKPELHQLLQEADQIDRLGLERHGAIRVGTAQELATLCRLFAVMGMEPVGYYDLSIASVPVHSTAFRPVDEAALARNPFRVFTSLLRLELIEDEALREKARAILAQRTIFTPRCLEMIELCEQAGGLTLAQAQQFIQEALYTFKWHDQSTVDKPTYVSLRAMHPLIADVVCFKGPHINHLTPRTLDIDQVQARMPEHGMAAKQTIEGPPRRECPILLRQTSFMALSEPIYFEDGSEDEAQGTHTARFGEIEQRGVALTPAGRTLYDELLAQVRDQMKTVPKDQPDYAQVYMNTLSQVFTRFPDNYRSLREQNLAYFYARPNMERLAQQPPAPDADWNSLVQQGYVTFSPITYEDFLPVSAAGIFQSNLGAENKEQEFAQASNQDRFEADLGRSILDELELYAQLQQESIMQTYAALGLPVPNAH